MGIKFRQVIANFEYTFSKLGGLSLYYRIHIHNIYW